MRSQTAESPKREKEIQIQECSPNQKLQHSSWHCDSASVDGGTKYERPGRRQTAESPRTPLDFLLPRNPLYPCEHLRSPGIMVRASPCPSRAPYTFCQGTPSPGSGFRVQGLGFEVEGLVLRVEDLGFRV